MSWAVRSIAALFVGVIGVTAVIVAIVATSVVVAAALLVRWFLR